MAKEGKKLYSAQELSAFCLQLSILLRAAIPLDEGLSVMSEDASKREEQELLIEMSRKAELGSPLSVVLEEAGVYPSYVIHTAKLGEETGTLDEIMESLAGYYEKEYRFTQAMRHAVTYPVMMVIMLLVVLLVLFTKVMPIFESVYEQLGAELSPVSLVATRLGGIFCGTALAAGGVFALLAAILQVMNQSGRRFSGAERVSCWVKKRSRIALAAASRRFAAVLALTLHSGLGLEEGIELAVRLVNNPAVEERLRACCKELEQGADYYTAMKNTGLFKGLQAQMIKVGSRSGRLDLVMKEIAKTYEEEADEAMERLVSRFEPTVVSILAVAVGLILLSVMLPLVGALSAIG